MASTLREFFAKKVSEPPSSDSSILSPPLKDQALLTDAIAAISRSKYTLKYMAMHGEIKPNQPKQGQHTWLDQRPKELKAKYNQAFTQARCL